MHRPAHGGGIEDALSGRDGPKVIVVYCTAGVHRSQGSSKGLVQRVLNAITYNDQRLYNARVFTCEECEPRAIEETVIKQAIKWMTKPWALARPPAQIWRAAGSLAIRLHIPKVAFGSLLINNKQTDKHICGGTHALAHTDVGGDLVLYDSQ